MLYPGREPPGDFFRLGNQDLRCPHTVSSGSDLVVSSLQVFLVTVWNFELYMIPLALLLLFVYNFIRPAKGKVGGMQDSQVSSDSSDCGACRAGGRVW